LRLPPGAPAVRCPNCKTVLEVEPADAPPAPAAPVAPPLPFGRPRPATPIAPPRAAPVPTAPPKRARLAPDQRPDANVVEAGEIDEDEKLRQIRRELAELDEKEIEQEEWLAELAGHCKHGRTAMHLLTWGVRVYALAVLLQLVAVAAAGFQIFDVAALAGLVCLAFAGIGSLLFCVGFGFAIAGPLQSRHIGVMGLVISILHALGAILQPGNLAIMVGIQGIEHGSKPLWSDFLVVQDMLGLATDLPLLADHPARFIQSYNWSIPGMVVAALEFTRLVLLAMLTQHYATDGKDPETGHRAFTTVNRVFWVVLLACSFRLATAGIFDNLQADDMLFVIGAAVHGSITFSCYFSLMIALLLFSRTMSDTIDLVDHRRYADKRERLEL
jgi:hypothetical protein